MGDQISVKFVEQGGQELENKIAKLEAKYRQLQQSMRDTGGAAKESGGALVSWGRGQIDTVTKMAMGYLTVSKAIDFCSSAMSAWDAKMKAAHETAKKNVADLTQTLFAAGSLGKMPEVKEMLQRVGRERGGTATLEKMQEAYGGVVAGSPDIARDPKRLEQTLRVVSQAAPVDKNLGKTGEQIATIQEVTGLSAQKSASLLYQTRQYIGAEKTEQLTGRRMMAGVRTFINEKAGTPEQAFAIGAMMLEKDVPAAAFETFMVKSATAEVTRSPKNALEAQANQIARLPANKRPGAIMGASAELQEHMLGGKLGSGLKRMEDVGEWQQGMTQAMEENAWDRMQWGSAYRKPAAKMMVAVRQEKANEPYAKEEAARDRERAASNLKMDQDQLNPVTQAILKTGRETIFTIQMLGNDTKTIQATAAAQNARSNAGER